MFALGSLLVDTPGRFVHICRSGTSAPAPAGTLYLSALSPPIGASGLACFHSLHTHILLVHLSLSVPLLATTIVNASLMSSLFFLLSILHHFYHWTNSHVSPLLAAPLRALFACRSLARFVLLLVASLSAWVAVPPVVSPCAAKLSDVCALAPPLPPALPPTPPFASPLPWLAIASLPVWDRSSSSVAIPILRSCDLCIRLRSKISFDTKPHWPLFHPDR